MSSKPKAPPWGCIHRIHRHHKEWCYLYIDPETHKEMWLKVRKTSPKEAA